MKKKLRDLKFYIPNCNLKTKLFYIFIKKRLKMNNSKKLSLRNKLKLYNYKL